MVARFKRTSTVSTAKAVKDQSRMTDQWEMLQYPKNGKWVGVRLVGPTIPYGVHWIDIITRKGATSIPKYCLAFDPDTGDRDSTKQCPYCDLDNQRFALEHYSNVIDRKAQESKPRKLATPTASEKKTGFKEKTSPTWTPAKVVRLTQTQITKLQGITDLNIARIKGESRSFDLSHPKFGADVFLSYHDSAKGTDKYQVQKGERTPLSEEELDYYLWDIEDKAPVESLAEAKKEAKSLAEKAPQGEDDDDNDDDDTPKPKKKGKAKPEKDDDYDDDLDEDDDDLDDDEDDEEEGDDDDDDDLDDEEEETPRRKKTPTKKAAAKSSKRKPDPEEEDDDLDEDDDDLDEDEEEEEEEPPRRKKPAAKKAPAKSSKRKPDPDEDEDDDDLDEDEDEEEEEEPPRRKKPAAKVTKKVTKRKPDPEEEDDDDDLDEDDLDDEEEEEIPRRKKVPAKRTRK